MEAIRISAISYLNTVPFIYGIKHSGHLCSFVLSFDVPSSCARKVLEGEADIGIVPVAAIPHIPDARIVSSYCIGATGPVRTVLLASLSPLNAIDTIYLDPDSRTSVQLIRLLVKYYWKIEVTFRDLSPAILQTLPPGSAAMIIGDKTFGLDGVFPYVYDLAEEWMRWTGMPFVFACWVSRGELPLVVRKHFSDAIEYGIHHIDEAVALVDPALFPDINIRSYLTEAISYPLDRAKTEAMDHFLKLAQEEEKISQ